MTDLTINDVLAPPTKREYHLGIIQVSAPLLDGLISIDKTDLQGKLRDTGTFKQLHEKLLLPASYSIFGVFYRPWQGVWEVCVESPDLPVMEEYCEPPTVTLRYNKTHCEDGTSYPQLIAIDVESR